MNVQHSQALIRISLGVILCTWFLLKSNNSGWPARLALSIGLPAIALYAVILGETLGGLALIFGVLSRWAADTSHCLS